jgi:ribulose 1,5-bisphosphate carboxylase large subunit-like protein
MFNIYKNEIDKDNYIIATYKVSTIKDLKWAAWQIATGQSVGNPNIRNKWETDDLFEKHSCIILNSANLNDKNGEIKIGFPIVNFDFEEDGITQLMTSLFGGQLDIKHIDECKLIDIHFPSNNKIISAFKGPKYGITGLREKTKVYNKPMLLGIIKPKIITSEEILCSMVEEMIEGGCNLIKEDEIHSNPPCLPLSKRVPIIEKLIRNTNVVYFHTVNTDSIHLFDRVKLIEDGGGNGIHINFWAGLGAYKSVRDMNTSLALHFQTSGTKILSDRHHRYSVSWPVICMLAGLCGVDMAHVGMIGGYGNYDEDETLYATEVLQKLNVLPSYSCGMTAGNVNMVTRRIGCDYAVGAGGSMHGHPFGTRAGARAIAQAIDGVGGIEYDEAIRQWGLKQ